jgi:hypothetical protein
MPRKLEALSSNTSATKKQNKKNPEKVKVSKIQHISCPYGTCTLLRKIDIITIITTNNVKLHRYKCFAYKECVL